MISHQTNLWKYKWVWASLLLVPFSFLLSFTGMYGAIGTIGLLIGMVLLVALWKKPALSLLIVLNFSLILPGTRFTDAPLGLLIDALLFIGLAFTLLQWKPSFTQKMNNPIFWCVVLWFGYTVLELFNPEVVSYTAWIYAIRNLVLHFLIVVLITLVYFGEYKHFRWFIDIWLLGSLLGAGYAMKQHFLGLTPQEYAWAVESKTHIIFGQIRLFSFYSDAGVFGACMGYSGIVAAILVSSTPSLKRKIWYIVVAVSSMYAMALSGTRGAIFVPLVGIMVFLFLVKNVRMLILGALLGGMAFGLLKFTYLGEDNFQIRRMRSALEPTDDPSFIVRLNNQEKMKEYMATRPFGGGVGSMGFWGKRFSPDTFLGNMPPDSWYVWIWGENGIVGLILYLGIIAYILFKGAQNILKVQDGNRKIELLAIFSGTAGIVVASYGNPLIGQIPCNFYFYLCCVYFFTCPQWENSIKNA